MHPEFHRSFDEVTRAMDLARANRPRPLNYSSMKQFKLPAGLENALFFVQSTGEIYYTNIVRGSKLADEWVHLCWGEWKNVPDDDFESLNEHISARDNWTECDGKPFHYALNFEDGCVEFNVIDRIPAEVCAALEAVCPA